jgi:hypothetical protein
MGKYFIFHKGVHDYAVECKNCGRSKTLTDDYFKLEIVKVVYDSCDACSPAAGRYNRELYLSDNSRLMPHGLRHPDGSWSDPFFKSDNGPVPPYVLKNAVNVKKEDRR